MTVSLVLSGVSARYGATRVLDDLSLTVAAGELVSLLGASGCGKTTTLRLVAGFLAPSSGTIALGGTDLTGLPAHRRGIGLVFQSYALFPHLSVAENVGFGLVQRRVPATERARRVRAALERTGLAEFALRLPGALSGGQRQRVALARALVIEPPLLMLDEPLSNLDARLRLEMRGEIRSLQRAQGATAVYVTHDQEEAFSISDRVAIMHLGRVLQFDRPEVIYARPADAYVAGFVGFENLIPLQVSSRDGARVTAGPLTLSQDDFGPLPDRFTLAARPEGLAVTPAGTGSAGIGGRVLLRTYLGRAYQYRCETDLGPLAGTGPLVTPFEPGTPVILTPVPEQCAVLGP
jgi:putative spermidine/putrescine transport system ATP-binding protein